VIFVIGRVNRGFGRPIGPDPNAWGEFFFCQVVCHKTRLTTFVNGWTFDELACPSDAGRCCELVYTPSKLLQSNSHIQHFISAHATSGEREDLKSLARGLANPVGKWSNVSLYLRLDIRAVCVNSILLMFRLIPTGD
jgi:hypothetical protein